MSNRNAVVIRVSEQGDRPEETFHSPEVQLENAKRWAREHGELVTAHFYEIDVSGKLPLAKRPGLLAAIELVEAGEADQILAAYFDRLVRSLKVQLEVIERVERAGGEIYALDHGKLTNGTAATRLSANMMGAAFQYFAEVTGEKVTAAQARAVDRGVYPHPKIPPGLKRDENGKLVADRGTLGAALEAFELRDHGATLAEIRDHLGGHGVERTMSGVVSMLSSKLYLGEIHFGKLVNLHAHKPVIDRDLFERVQRRSSTSGRRAKSQRLLARLGVLRCATCGGRMVVSTKTGNYRCNGSALGGCDRRVAVKAHRVEQIVLDRVREYTKPVRGTASLEDRIRSADSRIERAQADLDEAIGGFAQAGLGREPAAVERLAELGHVRDQALAARAKLGSGGRRKTMSPDEIDQLADPARRLREWRGLIVDTVESVTVAPARSRHWDPARITVEFFVQ